MYPVVYRALRLLWRGGFTTRRYQRELQRTQWLSSDELEALQLEKLQQLVIHAYDHVPFYQQLYQNAGVEPQDIKSLNDFAALPFLTREDVRHNLDALVAENWRKDDLFPNETGGSTGEPVRFYLEDAFWWWNAANVFRVRGWHGVREGSKIAWIWGARQDLPGESWRRRLRAALMQERYLNAFDLSETTMGDFASLLVDWEPHIVKGYASALSLFARYLQQRGITGIRPRYVEATSEKLSAPQRELLEDTFACSVADHYSCREMGTLAYQCQAGGFHICADVRHVELVSGDKTVQAGQLGEVVVTSLNQYAMPFIRYKNGDMAIKTPQTCRCRRELPLLAEVVGRTNDYLVAADERFVHSEFFAYLFRTEQDLIRYQVYQPDKDHLQVRLVCAHDVGEGWLNAIRRAIHDHFGPTTSISLQMVDQIPLTAAGKHRYVISDVEPTSNVS
jgi:phenylacetate-CoA ligase